MRPRFCRWLVLKAFSGVPRHWSRRAQFHGAVFRARARPGDPASCRPASADGKCHRVAVWGSLGDSPTCRATNDPSGTNVMPIIDKAHRELCHDRRGYTFQSRKSSSSEKDGKIPQCALVHLACRPWRRDLSTFDCHDANISQPYLVFPATRRARRSRPDDACYRQSSPVRSSEISRVAK
jgi:hypothetical protein